MFSVEPLAHQYEPPRSVADIVSTLPGLAAVLLLFALNLLGSIYFRRKDEAERQRFVDEGGADAMETAGIALPGLGMSPADSKRKELPPSEDVAVRKPTALFDPKKTSDFWGLQPVPEVALSGVKTIDKVVKPGGKLVVTMTRSAQTPPPRRSVCRDLHHTLCAAPLLAPLLAHVSRRRLHYHQLPPSLRAVHNAISHISNNIKVFAAARLGAPEIRSTGMKSGLPSLEIFRTTADGERVDICSVDCRDGLRIASQAEWNALDKSKSNATQSVPCTALITSLAEWLVFCRSALDVKDDMAVELLDSRTTLPLMNIAENNYVTAAPWVTTPIRYGGFFGFCKTEREVLTGIGTHQVEALSAHAQAAPNVERVP